MCSTILSSNIPSGADRNNTWLLRGRGRGLLRDVTETNEAEPNVMFFGRGRGGFRDDTRADIYPGACRPKRTHENKASTTSTTKKPTATVKPHTTALGKEKLIK